VTDVDETDCENVTSGAAGNLCHVDCSNRWVASVFAAVPSTMRSNSMSCQQGHM